MRRKVLPRLLPLVALGVLVWAATPSAALQTGITGYSGKDGFTCTQCHDDGTTPLVRFEGPDELTAGEAGFYRFVVRSQSLNQRFAGFNVAAGAGVLAEDPAEEDARLDHGELTHVVPKETDAGLETAWSFTWQAPETPGTVPLYGAGLSANGNGNRGGDQPARTTLRVLVTPGPPLGDGNCDGRLSAADLVAVALAETRCDLADADCDGMIDDADRMVIAAALFDPAPLGCPSHRSQ